MKTVYLFLATGFEEIEALTIVDMLRRAEIDITTVSISRNLQVEGAHGITVTADCTWVELSTEDADWLILPGGMPGTKHLGECKPLVSLLQRQAAAMIANRAVKPKITPVINLVTLLLKFIILS